MLVRAGIGIGGCRALSQPWRVEGASIEVQRYVRNAVCKFVAALDFGMPHSVSRARHRLGTHIAHIASHFGMLGCCVTAPSPFGVALLCAGLGGCRAFLPPWRVEGASIEVQRYVRNVEYKVFGTLDYGLPDCVFDGII